MWRMRRRKSGEGRMLTIGPVDVWTAAEDAAPPADADVAPGVGWSALAAGLIGEAAKVIIDPMRVAWKPAGAPMPELVYAKGLRFAVELRLAGLTAAWLARALGFPAPSAVAGGSSGDSNTAQIELLMAQGQQDVNGRFGLLLRGPSYEFKGKNTQVFYPSVSCLNALELSAGTEEPQVTQFNLEGLGRKADRSAFDNAPHLYVTTGVAA